MLLVAGDPAIRPSMGCMHSIFSPKPDRFSSDSKYLLAKLHMDSLIRKRSPKAIKNDLKLLPKGLEALDNAYREVMERVKGQSADSKELANQVLAWITCAKSHLGTSTRR